MNPFQIWQTIITELDALKTFHEEAEVIIILQLLYASEQTDQSIHNCRM